MTLFDGKWRQQGPRAIKRKYVHLSVSHFGYYSACGCLTHHTVQMFVAKFWIQMFTASRGFNPKFHFMMKQYEKILSLFCSLFLSCEERMIISHAIIVRCHVTCILAEAAPWEIDILAQLFTAAQACGLYKIRSCSVASNYAICGVVPLTRGVQHV